MVRRQAGRGGAVASPIALAHTILGPKNVRAVAFGSSLGLLAKIEGDWTVAYHRDLDRHMQQTVVAHELGHWALRSLGFPEQDDEEDIADAVAKELGWVSSLTDPEIIAFKRAHAAA